jgi:Zn-dependent protease
VNLPLETRIYMIPIVLLAFALHEMAHAYAATWFGDPTPKAYGRKTLNPIRHLDPIGTVMLVVTLLAFSAPMGFAVTPVNDSKMRRPRLHGALTSFAGPLVNLAFCVVGVFATVWVIENSSSNLAFQLAFFTMVFNAFLFVFNLLPIPPLDGGRIVGSCMNDDLRREWNKIAEYGMFIILGIILLGGASFSSFIGSLERELLKVVAHVTGHSEIALLFGP